MFALEFLVASSERIFDAFGAKYVQICIRDAPIQTKYIIQKTYCAVHLLLLSKFMGGISGSIIFGISRKNPGEEIGGDALPPYFSCRRNGLSASSVVVRLICVSGKYVGMFLSVRKILISR